MQAKFVFQNETALVLSGRLVSHQITHSGVVFSFRLRYGYISVVIVLFNIRITGVPTEDGQ